MIGLNNINDNATAPFADSSIEANQAVRFPDILFDAETAEQFLEAISDRNDMTRRLSNNINRVYNRNVFYSICI